MFAPVHICEHSANGHEYFIFHETFVAVVATVVSQSRVASRTPTIRQTPRITPILSATQDDLHIREHS